MQTQATAIAVLEARRNEEQTLAEGALLGERRSSLVRVAMVVLFGVSVEVIPRLRGVPMPSDGLRVLVGSFYTVFAIATVVAVRRATADPRRSALRPALLTVLDFAFLTFMATSDIRIGLPFQPEMAAAASAVLISFSITRSRLWHVALSVGCAIGSFLTVAAFAERLGAMATPFVIGGFLALGVMIGLTNDAVHRMFRDLRRRDNLSRFLPRQIAERLLALGPEALQPVQREVTVLFSDIRGFTALSEALPPREVLELLDDYFGHMSQIVKGHDGVVGKFLGDGMLAFWNVPDRDPDHAAKAVRAALDMQRGLAELNAHRAEQGAAPLRVGIGIHTGPVAAGMLGGPEQSEYTVIGDAVNVASRIEGLTKTLGADVLISETTWQLCGDRFAGQRLASEEIRGRREPVVLYSLAPPPQG